MTDAGRSYVADCRCLPEEIDEAARAASGEYSAPKGNLIITAPIVFGRLHIVPIVAEFLNAAIAGVGITRVLWYQIADALRAGGLRIVREDFESEPLPVSLVYAAQGPLPLKLHAFLDFATPRLKTKLQPVA